MLPSNNASVFTEVNILKRLRLEIYMDYLVFMYLCVREQVYLCVHEHICETRGGEQPTLDIIPYEISTLVFEADSLCTSPVRLG